MKTDTIPDAVRTPVKIRHVSQTHPKASDQNPGSRDLPFRSIQAAAELAMPGDTVLVHQGVYRERVAPPRGGEEGRPITYEAVAGEDVVIRGSERWAPAWEAQSGRPGVYIGHFPPDFFDGFHPFSRTLESAPGRKTRGQIFVGGGMLLERDREEDVDALPGSWMSLPGGAGVRIHFPDPRLPPEALQVEVTVRDRVFAPYLRGLGHIVVRGFVMEHCANDFPRGFWESDTPQAGALGLRGGHHWVVENNILRHAKTVGLDCGSEGRHDADGLGQPEPGDSGHHLIRNNVISDNGGAGIMGYRSPGTRIVGNVLERNNSQGFTAPETAAIKMHFFTGGLIEGNLIRDNDTAGIWLDNVWHDSRVTRNVMVANQGAGLFIEMGYGPLMVDHNIIAFTRGTTALGGDGVYSHDASGVTFAHNLLFFNANFGVWSHLATDRRVRMANGRSQRVQASDWRILNNIFVGNHRGAISLPPESEDSRNNVSDFNVLAGGMNLVTQESHAQVMDPPWFLVNVNKGRHGKGEMEDPGRKPLMNLHAWREATGGDGRSRHIKFLRPMFSVRSLHLDWIVEPALREMGVPKVEGLATDFFGSPLPEEKRLPGPFQSMVFETRLEGEGVELPHRGPYNAVTGANLNRFLLWPPRRAADGGVSTATRTEEDFKRDF